MTPPYYTVKLESITEAWNYSTTHGDTPDPDDVVQLADGLTYAWSWEQGLISGQLDPSTATARLLARTADDVPAVDVGDLMRLQVRIGTAGDYIIDKVLRVSGVDVELVPPDDDDPAPYAAEVALELADTLADLPGIIIGRPLGTPAGTYGGLGYSARSHAREYWRPRLAEVSVLMGRTLGCPDWWSWYEQPTRPTFAGTPSGNLAGGLAYKGPDLGDFQKSARLLLTELLNSYQPIPAGTDKNITHTVVPYYGASYPSGYSWAAGVAGGVVYGSEPAPADPNSTLRYMAVPASRRGPTSQAWHGVLDLDAAWCRIPARARRSREHVVNTVRMGGSALVTQDGDLSYAYKIQDGVLEYKDASDVAAHGPSTRDLPTQLYLYATPQGTGSGFPIVFPAPAETGPRYLSVVSARNAGYTYGEFILDSSLMSDADAAAILPAIAPRWPGETDGDGLLLRHVTLSNLDAAVGFGGTEVSGFLRSGSLTIADGELTWSIQLTPGDPT